MTTWRAMRSASMISAPRSASMAETVLLPDAIPPVSPTSSTAPPRTAGAGPGARAGGRHPHEDPRGRCRPHGSLPLLGSVLALQVLDDVLETLVGAALLGLEGLLGVVALVVALDVGGLLVALVAFGVGALLEGELVLGHRDLPSLLLRLLERQGDAPAVQVDVDHLDGDLLADADDLLGDVDVPLGQLGDVDQALDAVVHPDEGTERDQLGDPTGDQLTDLVGTGELAPRVDR